MVPGEIHRGSRYVVSRAQSPATGAAVVVKALRAEPPDAAAALRLKQEYELLASLDLPGIVRAIAFEAGSGRPALILEDAGAQNLKQWLHHRQLSPGDFLAVAIQLAEALVRLHGRGIIHRDINPWNVVVDQDQRATLVDFDAATVVTGVASRAGVPARLDAELSYVAPEETGRMNRLVDHRADLYSMGAVFYEMLTGQPPFVSTDPVQLVHAHLARAPVSPAEANPSVPALLSDVILRLLAKMPEARYQSARALRDDLIEAQVRLARDGAITPFALGLADLAEELPLPERLYQRDEQRRVLGEAWEAAAAGHPRLVVLAGPAGSGKSALAAELVRPVAFRKGRLVTAKLDPQQGPAPYAPFADAIRALVAELLSGPPAELAAWRQRIAQALGDNARVIADLAPEIQRLIGLLPPVPPAGVESETRLHLVFQTLVAALATRDHPLALVLDDLQWADAGSLRLLEMLATSPDRASLLLVVAVRPDECAGPVAKTLEALLDAPEARRIDLPPLDRAAVVELCRDVLGCEPARALPLGAVLREKTGGNPFFLLRMLRFLHQSRLLVRDPTLGTWTWDLAEIEKVEVSENVVDLLLVVLRRLPAPVQETSAIAACIGNIARLELVARVSGHSPAEASRALWVAVHAGLLVPLARPDQADGEAAFQFTHDRIRQAASLLLAEEARQDIHLRIARQLLREAGEQGDDHIYAIVDHFDRAHALVTDREERLQLSRLNVRAAHKARASSASGPALHYLGRAIALLPDDAWERVPRETFALYREAVQVAGLTGDLALTNEFFDRAVARAGSPLEKADLHNVRAYACIAQSARDEAFQWGCAGLRLLGIELPLADPGPETELQLRAIDAHLQGRPPASLLAAPRMHAPEQLARMDLLSNLLDAAYFHHPELFPFVATRMVNLSLEHGHSISSPQAYAAYAVLLAGTSGDYQRAHAFGRLALDLAARMGDPLREVKVLGVFVTSMNNWTEPLETSLPLAQDGQRLAFHVGDTYFAAAFSLTEVMVRLHQGTELGQLATKLRAGIAALRTARMRRGVEDHLVFLQAVRALQGLSLQDDDLAAAGTTLDARGLPAGLTEESGKLLEYHVVQLGVACLMRDFARAAELIEAVAGQLNRVPRFVQHVEYNFYSSLTRAARCERATPEERSSLVAAIASSQEQLGLWAKNSPENYGHKHLLVAAELARLEGRALEAADLYDRAITAAGRERFVQDEALANELCGRFYLAQGRRRIAALYWSAAIDAYGRWGARPKAQALETELGEATLTSRIGAPAERGPTHDKTGGVALDLLALFRAAEAVSSEVMLPRMLGKLMEVCLATAGAEWGAFVIDEDGQLFLRAVASIGEATTLLRGPLEDSPHLCERVVRQVARTGEVVVVGDASADETLAADPHVAARGVRSLLALPIVRQARLMGVLYLENNLATRAFTPERVRLLMTLSSQIATWLQNSLLFERLNEEIDERRRAEAAVRFLADAGATLAESLEYRTMLSKLTRLAVPNLGDWCVVHVVDGGVVQWVAGAHVDPARQKVLDEHLPREIGRPLPPHVIEVSATGASVLHPAVTQAVVEKYVTDAEGLKVVDAIGAESSMVLPLRAHGRFLGAMALASNAPDRRFGARDVAAAEELARRAALAIDNARLYRQAQEAIRLRDEFLSIASHELNTPIASLRIVAQGFEGAREVPSLPVFSNVMGLISRQSQRLATLVSDLLDVAQIPAGKLTLHLGPVDLAALVSETVALFREDLERAGCPLELQAEAGLGGRFDRARLQQALSNLLSNAIKFGPGKPITVSVARSGDRARLVVEDHGIGIPPDRLPHVFGRFERAVSARHYGGLGLGLYIVQAIVQAHGGTVTATSVPGEGATFTVELPL